MLILSLPCTSYAKSETFIYGGTLFTYGGENTCLPYPLNLCQHTKLGCTPNDTEVCLCIT